jgi:hypothetical protein
MLINFFGDREVFAYATAVEKGIDGCFSALLLQYR